MSFICLMISSFSDERGKWKRNQWLRWKRCKRNSSLDVFQDSWMISCEHAICHDSPCMFLICQYYRFHCPETSSPHRSDVFVPKNFASLCKRATRNTTLSGWGVYICQIDFTSGDMELWMVTKNCKNFYPILCQLVTRVSVNVTKKVFIAKKIANNLENLTTIVM